MEYEVKYAVRKSITLRVRSGKLYVIAPIGTEDSFIEELIAKHARWINSKIESQLRRDAEEATLDGADIARLKREARKYFTEKTEYFARLMGVSYGKIRISSAKGRFGSCSSDGNISYTYRLMLYPEVAREYVIVHELAHIEEMNHSKSFYALIEAVMPDYKERKLLLKK